MIDMRAAFYRELREAIEVYFNAKSSALGQSEADTLMVIVHDHVEHYFPSAPHFESSTSASHPGITLIDGEGINVAYEYGDALRSKLFEGLSSEARLELLEACIYAVNERLNNLEKSDADEDGE